MKRLGLIFLFIGVIVMCLCSCQNNDKRFEALELAAPRTEEFNDGWLFCLEPNGNPREKSYDDSDWRELTLPHDWSIEQDFKDEVPSSIGKLPGGIGWYKKHFTLPESYSGKRIILEFEGVYCNAIVYVNGDHMGYYPNGYVSFEYDITDHVVCDGKTDNIISVKVNVPTDEGGTTSRWYSGAGIYRDVNLTVTEPVHIGQWDTSVRTPKIADEYPAGKAVTVETKAVVANQSNESASVQIRQTILNYDGTVFDGAEPSLSGKKKIKAGTKAEFSAKMKAQNPQLWSLDDPALYLMQTEVIVDGVIVDTYRTRFGFTWSEFTSDKGFFLNGEWMKLHGVCLHHDQGALGAVANNAAMKRQIEIMQSMGVNAIRTAHNAASPDFMRLCDELGMLVMEESFDKWWDGSGEMSYGKLSFEKECDHPYAAEGMTWAEFDMKQIVKRDRNCPSIILWGVGNECNETSSEKGAQFSKTLNDWVMSVDPDHPTAVGENKYKLGWANEANMNTVMDNLGVAGFNYAENQYDSFHKNHPGWCILGTETASAFQSRGYYSAPWINGVHVIDNEMGNQAPDPAKAQLSSYDNTSARYGKTATDAWIYDRDREFVAGQFIWTGFDYIGEPLPHYGTSKSSYFGAVDTCGFPKDVYYLYQSIWTDVEDNPMVHILPHWNWENEALRRFVTYPDKSTLGYLDEGEIVDYPDDTVARFL